MKKQIQTLLGLIVVCSAIFFSSCVKEKLVGYGPDVTGERANVVLRLKTPGTFSPATRTMSVAQECKIENVHILAFKGTGDNLTLSYIVTGVNLNSIESTPDVTTFTATLAASETSGDTYRLMIVANARQIIESVFGASLDSYAGDKSYAAIQQALNKEITGKIFTGSTDVLPMWGDTGFMEVKTDMGTVSVNMVRSIARIDVGVGSASKDGDTGVWTWNGQDADDAPIPFVLEEVYIVRPNKHYTVAPVLANVSSSKAISPSLLSGNAKFGAANVAEIDLFKYTDVTDDLYTTRSIYIPESDVVMGGISGDGNHTDRMAVVVGGSYSGGTTSYYRLDFVDSDKALMDALRNHLYQFNITSVSGSGYPDVKTAYESQAMNMTANVLDWDDAQMNEIIFDGQSYLSISKREVVFSPMGGEEEVITIRTNIADWSLRKDGGSDVLKANGQSTYSHTGYGYNYTLVKTGAEEYKLTIASTKNNVSNMTDPRLESFHLHASRISASMSVSQRYTNLYVSIVNGQSARLYPEGTQLPGSTVLPVRIMSLKRVDIVVSAEGAGWLTVPVSTINTPNGEGLYTADFNVNVAKWVSGYDASTRSATITITPQGEEPVVYTITQESPYINISRPLEYIARIESSYSRVVDVHTNILFDELSFATEAGSSALIYADALSSADDPLRPRNLKFTVTADMGSIAGGTSEERSQFNVSSTVYTLTAPSIFKVPSGVSVFNWTWNTYGGTALNYLFPWNIETASVTFDSNNGLYHVPNATNPSGVNTTGTDPGPYEVTFTFEKTSHLSTDEYSTTFDNGLASDAPQYNTATITFRSGYQTFNLAAGTQTSRSFGYSETSYALLADVFANVRWKAAITQSGSWLSLREGTDTPTTIEIIRDDRKTAPVMQTTGYPAAGTTMDTKTSLNFSIVDAIALNGSDRAATVAFTNNDNIPAKFSPTIDPITITQYAPVLTHASNNLPTDSETIPQAGASYTVNVSTNLQGWGVKVYTGTDNSGTVLVTKALGASPVISNNAAAVASNVSVAIPNHTGTSNRTLAVYLSSTEFGGAGYTDKSKEIFVGTWDQSGLNFIGGENHVLYFAADGTLQVGRWGVDVTALANMAFFKFGSVIGFTNEGTWNNTSSIKFNPTAAASYTYAKVPAYKSDDYTEGRTNVSDASYHTGANIKAGKGDPCKLAGLTSAEAKAMSAADLEAYSSGWRLPTAQENAQFVQGPNPVWMTWTAGTTQYTYNQGTATTGTSAANYYETRGNSSINPSVVWLPVTQGTPLDKTGMMSLPAAGSRNTSGIASQLGQVGRYWSSNAFSGTFGYCISFTSGVFAPTNNLAAEFGSAVRCVRQ